LQMPGLDSEYPKVRSAYLLACLNEPDDCKNSFLACSLNQFTRDVKKNGADLSTGNQRH
jgi:hypothetical protein